MTTMRPNSGRRQRQNGVAIILLSLLLCSILLPMVGLAFDLTIMYLVKAKLSGAVDAAVLAAGRSLAGNRTLAAQQTQITNIALDFLNANMPQGYWGTTATPTVETSAANIVTQDSTNMRILITLQASVKVPLVFLQYIQNTATVRASAVAARRYLRMMIVLDRSSSMNSPCNPTCPIDALKAAVSNVDPSNPGFVQDFFEGQDDLGLVVFGGSAIVAYPPRNPGIPGGGGNGPDSNFKTIANPNIPTLVNSIKGGSNTGTAEGLTLAYRELQKSPQPLYYNVIVLFTDGMPNGTMVGWNGAAPTVFYSGDTLNTATNATSLLGTSTCQYKKYSDFTNVPSHQMVGWMAQNGDYANATGHGRGIYGAMMTNAYPGQAAGSGQDVEGWLSNPNDDSNLGKIQPTWSNNCTYANSTSQYYGAVDKDVASFPTGDVYGNNMQSVDYQASYYYHQYGSLLNPTAVTNAYQIGMVGWNAAYQAAKRIRGDATLKPTIYCIGYNGQDTIDRGFLKRLTNTNQGFTNNTWSLPLGDPQGPYPPTAYDSSSTAGMYYDAGPGGIAAAFQEVRSQILALAQ